MKRLLHALTPVRVLAALALAIGLWAASAVPYRWLELFVVAMVHVGAIPAVGYPLAWGWRGTWHTNRVGRALMMKARALAALFVVSVVNVWLPGAWWAAVYAAVVTWVSLALWRQFIVLLSVQRRAGRADIGRGEL